MADANSAINNIKDSGNNTKDNKKSDFEQKVDDNEQAFHHRNLNFPESQKRALYEAFKSRDARLDGQVFVGVSSTKIYCRPVCSAHMPKYENCTFFGSAAEAEQAGYRPCLVCRPELAPGNSMMDAYSNLARRAASLLQETCTSGESLEHLASRLGYTDRHLRRAFKVEFDVTPVQYLQTCRLLLAKNLLTDSDLSITQVASAAGFKSVRRFNDLFKEHYRLTPSDLRKRNHGKNKKIGQQGFSLHLSYRTPYRFEELLDFFRMRALQGVEHIDENSYSRVVRMKTDAGQEVYGWLRVENSPKKNQLILTMSDSLLPVTSQVVDRIRRQFDINCNPKIVYEGISSIEKIVPGSNVEGTRLPGCFDAFETATRAILGQQISVVAANKLAARIVEHYGKPLDTGIDGLTHAFITPEEVCAFDSIEDAFGQLGVIKTRSRVILQIAQSLLDGKLDFSYGANADEQIEHLLDIKGIGPWSANYIAMRVMSYPDAFLESDVGVKHAMPDYKPKQRLAIAEQWRPWRSYANICLWNSLSE